MASCFYSWKIKLREGSMNEGHLKKKLLPLRPQNVKCIIKGQLRFNLKRIQDTYKTKVSEPFCHQI